MRSCSAELSSRSDQSTHPVSFSTSLKGPLGVSGYVFRVRMISVVVRVVSSISGE